MLHHQSRESPAAHGRDHTRANVFPEESLGKTHAGAGRNSEEEGKSERNCHGLNTDPVPYLPALLRVGGGRRAGNEAMKLSLGKGGYREDVLYNVFVFHHPALILSSI